MAVILPSQSAEHGFSISNLVSRFRSKKRTGSAASKKQIQQGPAQETRPPLIPAPLPLVLPQHQATLSTLGWSTITFPQSTSLYEPSSDTPHAPPTNDPHPLQTAYENLFEASQVFFNLQDAEKSQWKHKLGSEEGWSKIPGEKEFITLRSLEYCPDVLRVPAKRYWDLMGAHLSNTLDRITTSLDLPSTPGLRQFVGPCGTMQTSDADKTATMLRLFRYESWEPKVVAEPHADLGLLSVVVGNVPGLEVWNGDGWFEIEKQVEKAGMRGASLLGGRQLERLSNGRYAAGGHRVVSYGLPTPMPNLESVPNSSEVKKYRFSIVFVLRAYEPVVINSNELETNITGPWARPVRGVTAGKMYEEIRGRHYNINIDMKEREKQRKRIKGGDQRAGASQITSV
jgi:hypothetical protein